MLALPEYPGRCVVVYRDPRAGLWWLYFLTGRSEASRDRRLRYSVDRLLVEPSAPAAHDDVRHYACTRSSSVGVVVGNGDHVDVLASAPELTSAVQEIEPEPDTPIHTPRIAVVLPAGSAVAQVVAVRRRHQRIDRRVAPVTLDRGEGVALHTYGGTAGAISVDAAPRCFEADVDMPQLASAIWSGLDPSLRIALAYGPASTPEPAEILDSSPSHHHNT